MLLSPSVSSSARQSSVRGFTLLEIMMALAIFAVMVTGIFAIAKGTLELSAELTESQERNMIRQNFIEFMRTSFRRLPPDAEVTLENKQDGSTYVPTISVFNGGEAFSPGPAIPPDGSVELFARQIPGGYLRIGLRMLDADQTKAHRTNGSRRGGGQELVLPLIERSGKFEWKFYDHGTGRWEKNWKGPARPVLAECIFSLDDGYETRSVFWIPPLVKNAAGIPQQPAFGPDGQPIVPGEGTNPATGGDPNTPGVPPTGAPPAIPQP